MAPAAGRPDVDRRRHVLSGNCEDGTERLAHYASQFPIVEVDATYYALPSERNARLWLDRTPSGFVFNIKASGLFTHHPVVVERLPAAVKELLPVAIAEKSRVYLRDIPKEAEKLIWRCRRKSGHRWSPRASSAAFCFSSRTGSPPGALTSVTSSSFATAATGRWPSRASS
jgi:uncharacterized protein DUF72